MHGPNVLSVEAKQLSQILRNVRYGYVKYIFMGQTMAKCVKLHTGITIAQIVAVWII